MINDFIPKDILPYVKEISERLWTGHASIMVGAGFSKNATAKDSNTKPMPSWYELGDLFYEKIHGRKPEGINYLNPLKLADEVQAAFGRPALNQLLKNNIVDRDFDVSNLHIRLMELPWSDVFTTNYDTLLERTCENVVSRRYDIVVNQEDIIYSKRPRIIKLHGSFPSERPLIITEEDYRTYPKLFAPFINTVQQSLLENALLLIGFSGDDPNFLQWIGWINDNLGKDNSPKIYLVGVLSLTDAQRRLLASKNIVTVDLTHWKNTGGDHLKALTAFIEYLHDQRKKRENLNWPSNLPLSRSMRDTSIEKIITEWKESRLSYPNWVILPRDQRAVLWDSIQRIVYEYQSFEELSFPHDINYAYELCWRFDKCLLKLYAHLIEFLVLIIEKYDPFKIIVEEGSKGKLTNNLFSKDIKLQWTAIALTLLRNYREEKNNEEWEKLSNLMQRAELRFSPEQRAEFAYEKVLFASFNADLVAAKLYLKTWPINDSLPFWEAKRAAMISEFGDPEEAVRILETALLTVRKRLNLSPVDDDYGWVSQESYIMYLLRFIAIGIQNEARSYLVNPSYSDFTERWTSHLQFKSDPWAELKSFDLLLAEDRVTENFELNKVSTKRRYESSTKDLVNAVSFFRFIETIGLPLSIKVTVGKNMVQAALEQIMNFSPNYAHGLSNRLREVQVTSSVLSRSLLEQFPVDYCDDLLNFYMDKYKEFEESAEKCAYTRAFTGKIPAIMSRLCVKSSISVKERLYEFIYQLYNEKVDLTDFGRLVTNLLSSSSPELIHSKIKLLLNTPFDNNGRNLLNYVDPFENLNIINGKSKLHFKDKELKDIFDLTGSNYREGAIKRLVFLYSNKMLSSGQSLKLGKAIWSEIDIETGFPTRTSFYKWYFMALPKVPGVDPSQLFRDYILKNTFLIQSEDKGEGVSMGNGRDLYASELIAGSNTIYNSDGILWTADELDLILEKSDEWLKKDQHYLNENKFRWDGSTSIFNEFHLRFRNISSIIALVFGKQKNVLNAAGRRKALKLINELDQFSIPVMKAKIMFYKELSYSPADYIRDLHEAMTSNERTVVIDALESSIFTMHFNAFPEEKQFDMLLLELLSQPLRWKIHGLMGDCMDTIGEIVEIKPAIFNSIEATLLNTLQYIKDVKTEDNEGGQNHNEILNLRQKALALGKKLYKSYRVKGTMPKIIKEWEEIANDPNEFGDVAVKWKLNKDF